MYCKNCGNIIPDNANFCHVCGTKVEIDNVFNTNLKEEFNEEIKDEPIVEEKINEGYQDSFNSNDYGVDTDIPNKPSKKIIVPGIVSTALSAYMIIQAAFSLLFGIASANLLFDSNQIAYNEYVDIINQLLIESAITLILGGIVSLILGIIGLRLYFKHKNKACLILSTIGLVFATICLIGAIVIFVVRPMIFA